MVNKYYALQKDVFDINKVTVVGSPTITSDGVASVTPSRDALHFYNFSEVASTHDWDLYLPFTVTQDLINRTNNTWLYRIDDICLGQWYTNSIFQIYLRDKVEETVNVFSVNLGTFNPNVNDKVIIHIKHSVSAKTIFAELIVNGSSANSLSKNYTGTLSWKNTEIVTNTSSSWSLPEGSIEYDLTKFKIYVDGQLVFQPVKPTYLLERRKEGFDLSKFTVVGSPTITEDGVVTYITGSNYVYIPPIDYTKSFAIKKIGFTQAITGTNYYFINGANTAKDFGGFVIGFNGSTRKLRLFLGSTGNTWDIAAPRESVTTLEHNTLYYVDLIYSGTNYTCILYDNNLNELERLVVNNSTPLYQSGNGIMIGSNYINATVYKGNIYLANITVENDGKELFTGAKENYYMLRR